MLHDEKTLLMPILPTTWTSTIETWTDDVKAATASLYMGSPYECSIACLAMLLPASSPVPEAAHLGSPPNARGEIVVVMVLPFTDDEELAMCVFSARRAAATLGAIATALVIESRGVGFDPVYVGLPLARDRVVFVSCETARVKYHEATPAQTFASSILVLDEPGETFLRLLGVPVPHRVFLAPWVPYNDAPDPRGILTGYLNADAAPFTHAVTHTVTPDAPAVTPPSPPSSDDAPAVNVGDFFAFNTKTQKGARA